MSLLRPLPGLLLACAIACEDPPPPEPTPEETPESFVNWENPHVHPVDMTPDGTRLLAVNTADNRLLVFNLTSGKPELQAAVPVGLDPISVRVRSNSEAWVVNRISDSISVVDLRSLNVVYTLPTDDEPSDVVFAGQPRRAFISCSEANRLLVVDPSEPQAPATRIAIQGEEPRALAVDPSGTRVYAAIFESGNGSTVLGGSLIIPGSFPPNVVSDSAGPYGGINPPPNAGADFFPAVRGGNPNPPPVSHIVKKNAQGRWMDDNQHDWTEFVSGPKATASGRQPGWELIDNDVAIVDTATLAVTYATGLMNINMALTVRPDGRVTVVGTDATNELRFEPNLNGRFLRVLMAEVNPADPTHPVIRDLNPHLTYTQSSVALAERQRSVGDPRGIVWNAESTRAYVTGMGSNNVVVMNAEGQRVTQLAVGEGPTGLVLDQARKQLYVLNKHGASVSVVSTETLAETARVPFFDPTPRAIQQGRKHLYDTHKNSGLGHLACGSCHVDARMDRLAWDLGDPSGEVKSIAGQNLGMGVPGLTDFFEDWHPMKGPMLTQTLQDVIGKEALHWRGDKSGLEEFNGAFTHLQGSERELTAGEMQEFEDFLATIAYPPNPYRKPDNSLPTDLPLPGHYTSDRFGPAGRPLPNGNAVNGMALFRPPRLLDANFFACSTCHTLPTGMGSDMTWDGNQFQPFPLGPNGEHHHGFVAIAGSTNATMKIPSLRNLYKRVGMELRQEESLAGFGFTPDGSVDSLSSFISQPNFEVRNDQEVADLVAFLLAFSGSELPKGSLTDKAEPPGPDSNDSHAFVGRQVTLTSGTPGQERLSTVDFLLALADQGKVGLVVKGRQGERARGYAYLGGGRFQSDRRNEVVDVAQLKTLARPGNELTFTAVPKGCERRIGIDRDRDGYLDGDELDKGARPDDPASRPGRNG